MNNPNNISLQAVHTIAVITNEADCVKAIEQIMSDCFKVKTVGLYCEWNHRPGSLTGDKIGKDFIVSICTYGGYCALFRMNVFSKIPDCLEEFLEGNDIFKIGVTTPIFSSHLINDYGIRLKNFGDVYSYVLQNQSIKNELTDELRKVRNDRNEGGFDHKKWTRKQLSEECKTIAAQHAHLCIELGERVKKAGYSVTELYALGF